MRRLQVLHLVFGLVIGAVVGVIVTAALTRSGLSEPGSVQITEKEHDHSAHGPGTQDDSDDSGHHERQAGMHQETEGDRAEHHDDQDDSSDSTLHAGRPERNSQEDQHSVHTH